MIDIRSPLPWIGGKFYSAQTILQAFPPDHSYDAYVDLFGGAAHILIQKPRRGHIEVYNDCNQDLVNFWLQCRDHAPELEGRCKSLPYSRALYYRYQKSLYDGTEMDDLERAVRWFYVLRSSFSAHARVSPQGWSAGQKNARHAPASAYRSAVDLFAVMQERLERVMFDCRDFAEVLKQYDRPRTLVYADPPYIDCERYYKDPDGVTFSVEDHERLAGLLNSSKAYVALSYYPHPLLEGLYPDTKWQRLTWQTHKHSQMTKSTREKATELLLCNYPLPAKQLMLETGVPA